MYRLHVIIHTQWVFAPRNSINYTFSLLPRTLNQLNSQASSVDFRYIHLLFNIQSPQDSITKFVPLVESARSGIKMVNNKKVHEISLVETCYTCPRSQLNLHRRTDLQA